MISSNKLAVYSKDLDGNITGYKLCLEDLEVNDLIKSQLTKKNHQLRRLSRVCDNLRGALDSLEQIEFLLRENGHKYGFDLIPHSLFCHAMNLYGACFVQGEKGYPLGEIYNQIFTIEIHNEMMSIRHKRFGHFDENHDVRSDDILWQVRVQNDFLVPEVSVMRGSYLTLPSESSLTSFKGLDPRTSREGQRINK